MAVLVGVGCHEMGILQGFLQEAKAEARLGAFVQPLLAFLKILLDLLFSLLTTFDEPLEAFAADKSVSGPTVKFLGSPHQEGDYATCSHSDGSEHKPDELEII
jgi:hypothetical protein